MTQNNMFRIISLNVLQRSEVVTIGDAEKLNDVVRAQQSAKLCANTVNQSGYGVLGTEIEKVEVCVEGKRWREFSRIHETQEKIQGLFVSIRNYYRFSLAFLHRRIEPISDAKFD